MIRAVIFDMYETLITHYESPLYFGWQMADDAGIPQEQFLAAWHGTDADRTVGRLTFEEVLEQILRENARYSRETFEKIAGKRIAVKEDLFRHLHPEILPMMEALRAEGVLVGLISNCYSEEAKVIRESVLFPYFDAVCLSCEQGVKKPDEEIYRRCMEVLQVQPEECIYVGDGGSFELETAKKLGMYAVQATWYFKEGTLHDIDRKPEFEAAERPMDVVLICESVGNKSKRG